MKKVVVISTSLRPGSNSHALAEQFAKGAEAAGHQVELISLRGKELRFCVGCLSCQQTGACIFKDDVPAIMDRVLNADVVCWATPIYYYEMSGQMKTLIDRMCFGPRPCGANAMYPNVATSESKASELALPSQSNVTEGKDYRFRDVYLLSTATEDAEHVPQRAIQGLTGWIDCYPKSRLAGTLFCGGVTMPRDIKDSPKLQQAYEMGKSV